MLPCSSGKQTYYSFYFVFGTLHGMAYEKTQVTAMGFKSTATYFKKEHWTDFDLIKASLTKWLYVRLSGCGLKSHCTHLNFRCHVCCKQRVPWRSGNFSACIWHDKNSHFEKPQVDQAFGNNVFTLVKSVSKDCVWNFDFLRNMKKYFYLVLQFHINSG